MRIKRNHHLIKKVEQLTPFSQLAFAICSLLLFTATSWANQSAITSAVNISVMVKQGQSPAKSYSLENNARLSNLFTQIRFNKNDYWYATAWLRQDNHKHYQHKKSQLEALIKNQIQRANKYQNQWQQVLDNVSTIKPSDRLVTPVHPDRVFAVKASNFLLQNGDSLLIPARPNYVFITGFVESASRPHATTKDLLDYLNNTSPLALADNSNVWLIRPDTSIEKLPIAYWNKRESAFIAPGSIIYIPASEQTFSNEHKDINQLYLELLQNQLIGTRQGE
ncbi:capsule biosynthesis GfcC family protein [Agarivorans litoreus]|uniref:capsule biosynthesis GfcC family protein n=1 Tax=Agarivorans litoreus TaxID=1510455 RepID=UPI001C7D92FA|nr:capsule biosynthesis GfcC family protein [Agarivorans litoreus]